MEELGALQDESLQEALLFALYSYSHSEWSGDVVFIVGDGPTCLTIIFSLSPGGAKLKCTPGRTSRAPSARRHLWPAGTHAPCPLAERCQRSGLI